MVLLLAVAGGRHVCRSPGLLLPAHIGELLHRNLPAVSYGKGQQLGGVAAGILAVFFRDTFGPQAGLHMGKNAGRPFGVLIVTEN